MKYTIRIIAAVSLCFVFSSSAATQERTRTNKAGQKIQQAEKQPKIYNGLKISVVGIKKMKETCPAEVFFSFSCIEKKMIHAYPGYDLVVIYLKFEKQPEFKETKETTLQISHYELYDIEDKKHKTLNKNMEFSGVDIFGFLCSVPEGIGRLKTLKIVFAKPESLVGELSLDLEKYEADGKK